MTIRLIQMLCLIASFFFVVDATAGPDNKRQLNWITVVNNNDLIPPAMERTFNSYNQPSVNVHGTVVIRARSRGGPPLGPPTHGIYMRDMANPRSEIVHILDKTTRVPQPNNLQTTFVETPSFPRIDMRSATIATRANHQPVHRYYLDDGSETRAGTTGIYSNPFGSLITGAAKLGNAPGHEYFGVPEFSGVAFEVFPGAPAITGSNIIVFKGNYTYADVGRTGVYFRRLEDQPAGGTMPAVLIANNTDTLIPGTLTVFGSTAPPSAAAGHTVFAGFDNELAPGLGGIYMAPLEYQPTLRPLVSIGQQVPGLDTPATFNDLGEAVAFDGRRIGFWGAWGQDTRTERLYCQTEGNKDRIDYCNQRLVCADTGEMLGDPNSVCDDTSDPRFGESCYTDRQVPVNQGIFVHDTKTGRTRLVADSRNRFESFLFWNYAGKPPCTGGGHSSEGDLADGESVRWRSSAFVAIAGPPGASYRLAFKARSEDGVDGIYLARRPGNIPLATVLDTTTAGIELDPEAPPGSRVVELGIEREGLRGGWLAVTATMAVEGAEEDEGMAGVYIARVH